MPVTRLDKVSLEQFLDLFDPSVRYRILDQWTTKGTEDMVCFECLDMCSSMFGKRTSMPIGPIWTYKTLDEIRESHLGDVPSRFQYPVAYISKATDSVTTEQENHDGSS